MHRRPITLGRTDPALLLVALCYQVRKPFVERLGPRLTESRDLALPRHET
jgi:hypothetical protein